MARSTAQRSSGRRATQKKQGLSPLVIGLIVAAAVAVLALAGLWLSGALGGAAPGEKIEDMGAGLHLQQVNDPLPKPYNSYPPTSGYHYGGGTAPWGVLTQPFPDALTVHNLEHGGVVIHYRQGTDQATIEKLTALTRQLQQQNPCIVLQPRPADQLDVPIAVTAWTYLLKLNGLDEAAITRFFRAHVGRGPEPVCPVGVQ